MLLRGKPEYMREIVAIDPSLFVCATADARQDLYMNLFVFSLSPQITKQVIRDIQTEKLKESQTFVSWLHDKLGVMFAVYDGALREVIHQSVLNRGEDTSDHFQCLILGFLWGYDIPSLQFLREARRTYHNLTAVHPDIQQMAWRV